VADTIVDLNDPLAVQLWAKTLDVEALGSCIMGKLIGTSSNAVIHLKDEMQSEAGAQIRFGLRRKLSAPGQIGDDDLEGNEELINRDYDTLLINQQRHAVRVKGAMSQQRVPWSMRWEGKGSMVDWWAERFESVLCNQLAGNSAQNTELGNAPVGKEYRYTGMQPAVDPDSTHWIIANEPTTATEAALQTAGAAAPTDSKFQFTMGLTDDCVTMAQTMQIKIRPVKMPDMDCYVQLIHPNQVRQLRRSVSDGDWSGIMRAAMQGGQITKSPMFTGAAGMWNKTIYQVTPFLPMGNSTGLSQYTQTQLAATGLDGICRSVFLGAQAGVISFGRDHAYKGSEIRYKWVEELRDYANKLGISASLIWGMKKSRYVGIAQDHAVITCSTYSPPPSM